MITKVEGIVINELEYGETSKIINVLTSNLGVIGIMVKGARTLKSQFTSSTLKLTYATFHINYKEGKLSLLTAVDIINNFKNIRKDIIKISYASFLLELASQVSKHSIKDLAYSMLKSSLLKIEENYDAMIITNILELKYLELLGVMPIIDCCSVCESTKSIATLSSFKGGYVCNNCINGDKLVSEKTIKLIRMFYYVDIEKITKLDIGEQSKMEINNFLNDYYDRYTGLYLKSKNFVENLEKLK